MFDFLQYGFIQNALLIGVALGLAAAFLSPYLVLNQQAMIADGLAHVSFTGLILGILLADEAIVIAIPFVMIASLLIKYLSQAKKINNDAAIGLVSAVSFAIGLILVKSSRGFNISIESMLVGNIFTASPLEITLSLLILGIIALFITFFYRPLFLITYDADYARFAKVKVNLLSYTLAGLTAFFIVVGVRTIGILLISALVIFPSVIASQWTKSFRMTLIFGLCTSVIIVILGIFIAHPLEIPAGSTIVVIYAILMMLSLGIKSLLRRA